MYFVHFLYFYDSKVKIKNRSCAYLFCNVSALCKVMHRLKINQSKAEGEWKPTIIIIKDDDKENKRLVDREYFTM